MTFGIIPFAVALCLVSAAITWTMLRVRILDEPNARSSHDAPMPRSGGVAIVVSFLVGYGALILDDPRFTDPRMWALLAAVLGVAATGLLDDLGRLTSFRVKLSAQLVAAVAMVASGLAIREIPVPFAGDVALGMWSFPLTVLWLVGLTNMFNFMDGLDGLAAGTAVTVGLFLAIAGFHNGSSLVAVLGVIVLAGALGFLPFNFPRARIFMGDVGSQFLGFVFAALAVMAADFDAPPMSILVVPLLFFNFIFDTAFTFCRRLLGRRRITSAHRDHLYQLMNRMGLPHAAVSAFHFAVAAMQGVAALWLIRQQPGAAWLAFVPFCVFQAVYAAVVTAMARRRGLTLG